MTPTTYQYFAYGSNMLTRRLTAADRAPSARPIGIGYVEGRRLTFDKASEDGSGKCDAEATGKPTDRVYGVMFEIALTDKAALDRAESLGTGYREEYVEVVTGAENLKIQTYIAIKKKPGLRPYHWYKVITVAGAVEHGLPSDYVEWLRAIESVEDPIAERRAKHEALLAAASQ
ncbi:MAG: gamma-glutamylcyclotransferase [Nitrospira sp.]|nr:gamma-glutamylcyclotransferase [Nitrospira sp.]